MDVPVQGGKIKCAFCGTVNIVETRDTKQGDGIICPNCGASIPKDAQHCGRCGIQLEFNCPKCNALNRYGTAFCVKCGVDIREETKRQQVEDLRIQEQVHRQEVEEKRKKRVSSLVGTGLALVILLCLAFMGAAWFYETNYTPSARSTKTAISVGNTATAKYLILFQDDFSNPNSGWDEYTSPNGTAGYASGGYLIHVVAKNWLVWDTPSVVFPDDFRIEVDATKKNGEDDTSQFGVACRYQDQKNFYFLAIANDGYAAIFKKVGGNYSMISSADKKWTSVAGIHAGSEANHLRADCTGSTLTLFANGTQVATAADDSFTGGGVALVAGTFAQGGTDILFNNFSVYRP